MRGCHLRAVGPAKSRGVVVSIEKPAKRMLRDGGAEDGGRGGIGKHCDVFIRIARKVISWLPLAAVISNPKGGQMRASSMAKCYHRGFRERISHMPNKRTTAPKIAPLSAAGSTAAVIVTHNRVELLRASLEQVVSQTHPVKWSLL